MKAVMEAKAERRKLKGFCILLLKAPFPKKERDSVLLLPFRGLGGLF